MQTQLFYTMDQACGGGGGGLEIGVHLLNQPKGTLFATEWVKNGVL